MKKLHADFDGTHNRLGFASSVGQCANATAWRVAPPYADLKRDAVQTSGLPGVWASLPTRTSLALRILRSLLVCPLLVRTAALAGHDLTQEGRRAAGPSCSPLGRLF